MPRSRSRPMAGAATVMTVLSRNTAPEPSTVAATAHRPALDFSRIGVSSPCRIPARSPTSQTAERKRRAPIPSARRQDCSPSSDLPAIVREGAVRYGHPVGVFLLLDRVALALGGEDELGGQTLGHRLLGARTRERDDPAHGQRGPAVRPHLDRHLERGATDAAALHLEGRLGVVDGLLEDRHAGLPRTLLDHVHGGIEDAFGDALLPLEHEVVHEFGNRLAVVARIGRHRPLDRLVTPAHFLPPLAPASFGRLAPYLERLCRRSFTPAESSVPRTM